MQFSPANMHEIGILFSLEQILHTCIAGGVSLLGYNTRLEFASQSIFGMVVFKGTYTSHFCGLVTVTE